MLKLSQQCNRIYQILKNGAWHCPQEWNFADGHCKRITDLNRKLEPLGQKIIAEPCDCGRHTSRVLKRKIINIESPKVEWYTPEIKPKQMVLGI